ncbi:hypothetical protein [Ornithinimicrobium kibberense]|uniref:hypothetical protein n=1 Tax=Ornithinimicrobium kibberense TaxID=282060 RepID=UPI003612D9BF
MEVGLDDLGGLGGVEPGGLVAVPLGDGTLDRAGGERLGPPLGHDRVHAPLDRVPHELRESGHQPERVEHDARSPVAGAGGERQEQVVRFGEGDQGRPGSVEQGRGEQVQGLSRPLGPDDPGGAVPRHPQVHPGGGGGPSKVPSCVPRIEPGPCPPRRVHLPGLGGAAALEEAGQVEIHRASFP